MIPKRIAVKNFLTFGEAPDGKPVELVFIDGEPLWVLCGANGTGKSAVFDAITYALYGEHRGGKQKAEQLVRHNATGFEVELDFEFGGTDYRIRRTRPGGNKSKGSRTTQYLLKRVGDEWKGVREDETAGAVKGDDIERWVSDTLGLDFNAFTNSVLLQQGKADKLFTAGRDERLAVLKGIIGFEQFETLSARIGGSARDQERHATELLARRDAIPEVSADDLVAAVATMNAAEADKADAQAELTKANERVGHARQWERLERERQELGVKIAAADERQKQGRAIREDKQALDDLAVAVPVLERLFTLRECRTKLETEFATAQEDVETKTARRDAAKRAADTAREKARRHQAEADRHAVAAKGLADEIKRGRAFLDEADAVAKLTAGLAAYPGNLDSLLTEATGAETAARDALKEADAEKTSAGALLAEAQKQQTRFAGVAVGVACPHCRQPVDAEHAARVRAEFASEVGELQGRLVSATTTVTETVAALATAQTTRAELQKQQANRDRILVARNARQESLHNLGLTADATVLRAQLQDQEIQRREAEEQRAAEAERHTIATGEAARLDGAHTKLDQEVTAASTARTASEAKLATVRGQEQTTLGQLSEEWQRRLPDLGRAQVEALAVERDRLLAENVTARFQELEQDATRRTVWEDRRGAVEKEIGGTPEDSRIPEGKARDQQTSAEKDAKAKTDRHTAAVTQHEQLTDRKRQREELTVQHRESKERHRLLVKLDKLLGETGLQRELVREAEEQIVAFANETLHHLSDGDLSLEEDTTPDSVKTFDLRVRRGGSEPIGVAFLSGSQKFRVAVSIALAVGRFASGRARPLESVIIDEGFGSLDPQGLQAMAAELKRLQQAKSLRRVILVSHQPDFTDQFSVGYTLTASENGTTATAFRR